MPHPAHILLRWIEATISYAVQFATGLLLLALSLSLTGTAVAALEGGTTMLDLLRIADWLISGLLGAVFMTFVLLDRLLAALRHGAGRLVFDLVMIAVMGRLSYFVFTADLDTRSAWHDQLAHPFCTWAAAGWLLMFFHAFIGPATAFRRLDPLPSLTDTMAAHLAHGAPGYGRLAVVGLLLFAPLVLTLPPLFDHR